MTLSGIVVSKSLIPDGPVVADGGSTANVVLNVNGNLMTLVVDVAEEVHYVLGSTITFAQQ